MAMMKMTDALKTMPTKVSRDKVIADIMGDPEVLAFCAEHRLNEEQQRVALPRFNEYLVNRRKGFDVKLLMSNGLYVYVDYGAVNPEANQKYHDGILTSLWLDDATRVYKGVNFEGLARDEHNDKIIQAFERMVNGYRYGDRRTGVWLYGKFGRGKTFVMAAVANALRKKGVGVAFLATTGLIETVSRSFSSNQGLEVSRMIEQLKRYEVLILDDIGAENTREFGYKNVLYNVLAERANKGLLTLFTSNLTIDEFIQQVKGRIDVPLDGERMRERIEMLARPIVLHGDNRRVKA